MCQFKSQKESVESRSWIFLSLVKIKYYVTMVTKELLLKF